MKLLDEEYAVETLKIPIKRFELPERILQFGTGVLLRGLCDYAVDKANRNGVFNGRIVVVKSTSSDSSDFDRQNCVYTLQERGILDTGETVNNATVITAISRVVDATSDWEEVLLCAENPALNIIISNTTEAGLVYLEEDIFELPPKSFPAKLTAFLHERFSAFIDAENYGVTIIPTELIVDNGKLLKKYVLKHAAANDLPKDFIRWLKTECDFCDSLVDRIVSGSPSKAEKEERFLTNYKYRDELCIDSEPFMLWAIQGSGRVKERLSFALAENRVVITEDITPFREQKLRILNGGHTISINAAFLAGHEFVRDMMSDELCGRFTERVILDEIMPTVTPICSDAPSFANAVLNRFRNPFIAHKLSAITFQNTAKMQARNAETIKRYYALKGHVPPLMSLGFAAYLLFTKVEKEENGQFFGTYTEGSLFYKMTDDKAGILQKKWAAIEGKTDKKSLSMLLNSILFDTELFDTTLIDIPDFKESVTEYLFQLIHLGVNKTIGKALDNKFVTA
jgi:tagaturonate reductase